MKISNHSSKHYHQRKGLVKVCEQSKKESYIHTKSSPSTPSSFGLHLSPQSSSLSWNWQHVLWNLLNISKKRSTAITGGMPDTCPRALVTVLCLVAEDMTVKPLASLLQPLWPAEHREFCSGNIDRQEEHPAGANAWACMYSSSPGCSAWLVAQSNEPHLNPT